MTKFGIFLALLALLSLTACEQKSVDRPLQYSSEPAVVMKEVYRFAIHPLHNPRKLSEAYQPLIDHLNHELKNVQIELEASRDYSSYERKYNDRKPAFLLSNPWQTLQAIKVGYHVIATAGDAADFKGVFIVRKDSGIKKPADLKGKIVAYPSPTALAAAIMPQYYLHMKGIDVNRDINNIYVGSQESSIMNVYLGRSSAGATWPLPWRLFQKDHPGEAAQLEMIWETPILINNAIMVRDDVPKIVSENIRKMLLNLTKSPEGKLILLNMETSAFETAEDANYEHVRKFIGVFEREVRQVEKK